MTNDDNQRQRRREQEQQQQQQRRQQQQRELKLALEELAVAKVELTSGDTTGLVYVRYSSSSGSAFLVESRSEALRIVERRLEMLERRRGGGG
ncbi:hypothetical protein ACHAW5_010002 [Stephanodiscus triporus]|uniref:Uncharacterized protein n=1 Tax=Stephanodiscus triporus TaxID=2934178 RepID=A0ABD3NU46_9STRA